MPKNITLEQLALMIQQDFQEVHNRIETLKWELKDEINNLRINQRQYVDPYSFDKLVVRVEKLEENSK